MVGPARVALDVPRHGTTGAGIWHVGIHHPGVTSLSCCHAPHPRGPHGAGHLARRKEPDITIGRIQETLDQSTAPSWRDLRKPTGGLHAIVWIGVALAVFQQLVGINVIFYYSNVLWQAVGFGESSSFTITVITSITNIATTLVAIALIDRVGRKPLLLIGSAGMAANLGTMAVIFSSSTMVDGKPPGPRRRAGCTGCRQPVCGGFRNVLGPGGLGATGEIFPNRIRAAAMGLATAGNWAANWAVTVTFPALRDALGIAYGCYALCAVLSLLFVARWVQETKGRALEDMDSAIS